MTKRTASALLWFVAGWYAWATVATVGDLTPVFGPLLGAALAAVFAGDPMHKIWTPPISGDRVNSGLGSIDGHAQA